MKKKKKNTGVNRHLTYIHRGMKLKGNYRPLCQQNASN